MGSELIATWVWGRKENSSLDLEGAKTEASRLDADQLCDYWVNATGEDLTNNHSEAVEHIHAALDSFHESVDVGSRYLLVFDSPGGDRCYFAGGTSGGDDPCEEFTVLSNLSCLPTVLDVLLGA